jgi:hypothetical protein
MSFIRRLNKVAAQHQPSTMVNENSACMSLFCHSLDPSSNKRMLFSFPHPHFRVSGNTSGEEHYEPYCPDAHHIPTVEEAFAKRRAPS